AEFLHRYLSYLEDSDISGAMRKLFADHICALWRETQRDIFAVDSRRITLQEVSRGISLSPSVFEALAAVGIDKQMVDEYLHLNRRRSQIEPRATPVSRNAEFRRLQELEQRIGGTLRKGVSTKSVTFFDGS